MSNLFSKIIGIQLTTVSNPPAGKRVLYAKSDGWYEKNTAGVETKLVAQAGGQTKVYRATLTGSNGAVATTAVHENGLSAAIVWAYSAEGVYTGTLVGAFTLLKTNIQLTLGIPTVPGQVPYKTHTSADVITITTTGADGFNADFITTLDVQITVAP
jgi:hypothetical protein